MLMPYPWRCSASVVRRTSCVVCVQEQLPEIIKISNPYLVRICIMFLDCAPWVLVAPSTLVIQLWLKNQIFTFSTSSLKPPTDGASYYARRFPRPRLL